MNQQTANPAAEPARRALSTGAVMKAERLARRGLKSNGRDPDLMDVLWRALAGQDRFAEAAEHLGKLLRIRSGVREYQLEHGKLLRLSGQLEAAEVAFREVLASNPADADAAYFLAYLLRDRGAWGEARGVIRRLAESQASPREQFRAAVFLESIDGFADAETLLEKLLARDPRDPQASGLMAKVKEQLGEFEEALACYRQALDVQPEFPGGWLRLTWIRKVTDPADPDLARLEAAAGDGQLTPNTRACAHFALGKAMDDLGEAERAFSHFVEGNRLRRPMAEWSRERWDEYVDATLEAFPADWEPAPVQAEPKPVPIFIVGMLRSGTTLLEQLLVEHPEIVGRGELTDLPNLLHRVPAPGYPAAYPRLSGELKRRIRDRYLAKLVRDEAGYTGYVDKSPTNFRYIGPILELFPNALVVHARRDPRDVGLSLYFQPLEGTTSGYCYDRDDIVHFYHGYLRMMDHWSRLLGDRFVEVDYERLVTEPAEVTRELLDRMGLEPHGDEPAAGGSDERSTIRTASVWQARQPVHRRSVARWKRYEAMAPEFFRELSALSRDT